MFIKFLSVVSCAAACVLLYASFSLAQNCEETTSVGDICTICTPEAGGTYIRCDEVLATSYCIAVWQGWESCGDLIRDCPGTQWQYVNLDFCEQDLATVDQGDCDIQMQVGIPDYEYCGW